MRLHLVAPSLHGPPTGGTLYNARLQDALRLAGVQCTHGELGSALPAAEAHVLDSLYLAQAAAVRDTGARPLWLMLHYLPSLLQAQALDTVEREALGACDGVIVTSSFMEQHVRPWLPGGTRLVCVEPGVDAEPLARSSVGSPPCALMLANVVANKRIAPLLAALAPRVRAGDRFALRVVGSLKTEPDYAAACQATVAAHPELSPRVAWLGARPAAQARAELCRADLLVSASCFESYGMALAEARAAGVPILATPGGHAAAHVEARAGGELAGDCQQLAERLLSLLRAPEQLGQRKQAALAARSARPWSQAAQDLLAALV